MTKNLGNRLPKSKGVVIIERSSRFSILTEDNDGKTKAPIVKRGPSIDHES